MMKKFLKELDMEFRLGKQSQTIENIWNYLPYPTPVTEINIIFSRKFLRGTASSQLIRMRNQSK